LTWNHGFTKASHRQMAARKARRFGAESVREKISPELNFAT